MDHPQLYCVQTFIRAGRGVAAGATRHYGDRGEALSRTRALALRVAGVALYGFRGDARSGVWSPPHLIERHGEIIEPPPG